MIPSNGSATQTMPFLDANIFLRHLTNDNPVQSPACFALIEAIEQGKTRAWTSDLVISEVVFVLAGKNLYNLKRETIRDILLPLIGLPGIQLTNKRLYRRIFDLYVSLNIDYVDAYNAALMESRNRRQVYSYDEHYDRIAGLERIEP